MRAECWYAAADVYLLDDPLSAVDAHVGRHLFESCICGILKGRTRVLVTHQMHFLSDSNVGQILVVEDGEIVQSGTFSELTAQGVDFHQYDFEDSESNVSASLLQEMRPPSAPPCFKKRGMRLLLGLNSDVGIHCIHL